MYRMLSAMLLLTACSPAATSPSTTDPAVLPQGRIAVDAGDTAYTVSPDGADRIELEDPITASQPTWSADGSRIAWTSAQSGSPAVAIGSGSTVDLLVDAPFTPFYYAWDPTARRVAMLGNGRSGIELAVLDTTDESLLTIDAGAPYYFDWSPDGTEIVAHVGQSLLRILGPDGSVRFTEASGGLYQAPQWTASAVLWQDDIPGRVTAMTADLIAQAQSTQAILSGDPTADENEIIARPDGFSLFSIAGDRLVYLDRGSGLGGTLWLADGDERTRLNDLPALAFQWNRQATRLVWLQLVPGDEPLAQWVVWTDGTTTAFETHRPTAGFVNRYLPFWDQYSRSLSIWSPDGDSFVYTELHPDDGPIVNVQSVTSGGPPGRIGAGEFASWAAATLTP